MSFSDLPESFGRRQGPRGAEPQARLRRSCARRAAPPVGSHTAGCGGGVWGCLLLVVRIFPSVFLAAKECLRMFWVFFFYLTWKCFAQSTSCFRRPFSQVQAAPFVSFLSPVDGAGVHSLTLASFPLLSRPPPSPAPRQQGYFLSKLGATGWWKPCLCEEKLL